MYHPTTRMLAVLSLLQAHGRMTGAELAERLEVNIRTVRDYIAMLQDLGAPIWAERGRHGAYELDARFKLPPMLFSNEEGLALALGLLSARQLALPEIIPAIESARSKLEQGMSPELKTHVQALGETVTLDHRTAPIDTPEETLLMLSRAARLERRVRLWYKSGKQDESEREFDPYGLACRQGKWYVVGRCDLRHALRSFRLDRVSRVELTTISFQRPKDFDALGYVTQSIATLPRQFAFEVLLQTDLATARREIFEVLGVLEPDPDGLLLRGSAEEIGWVARQLSALSFPFVVRAPAELRTALVRRAAELISLANA